MIRVRRPRLVGIAEQVVREGLTLLDPAVVYRLISCTTRSPSAALMASAPANARKGA